MKSLLALILVLINSSYLYSQCPSVDFTIPSTACKNAELSLPATISNAASFSWDFCDGSVLNTPALAVDNVPGGISDPYDLKYVEENGNHYNFIVSLSSSKVFRLDYGTDLTSTPVKVDLGNFGIINEPLGIGFWKELNQNFALVTSNSGTLVLLSFGNSILNTPTANLIPGVTSLTNHRQMKIVKENGSVLAIIAGGSSGIVSVLNFGASIQNAPTISSIPVPNSIYLTGLDLMIDCNNHFALVSGYGSGLHMLSFGSSFLNVPTISQPAGLASGQMMGLSIVKAKNNFHAFVSSQTVGLLRIDFGTSLANPTPARVDLGIFNGLNFAIGQTIVKDKAKYYSISVNYEGRIRVLDFPKDCDQVDDFRGNNNPLISFTQQGNYSVTLSASGANGELATVTKNITISNDVAPPFMIIEDGACVDSQVTFVGQQMSGAGVSGLSWNFGDGAQGTGQNAIHQYSSTGMYMVVLSATAVNGCVNRVEKEIEIYNTPVSSFTLPSGLLCTNNEFTFVNTTPDSFDGNLTYQWLIDNQPISTTRDLLAAFTSPGSHDVTLQTFIPGCSDGVTQNMSGIIEGPLTDFSFSGQCQDETITFTNTSSGTVSGYTWNFDDGQNSTVLNPTHIFSTAQSYNVSLTAFNTAGCNNTETKSVSIYSKPQINFAAALPPFSCNGTPTLFNDLTPNPVDSNIASWLWNFGDSGSGQNTSTLKNPQHTYITAGNYDVSLTVSTNFLCSSTLQLPVTISQAPVADFNFTPPCEDVVINFSDTSIGAIQSWNWQIGSTFYSTQNPMHTFSNPVSTNATLNVTATNNCIGSITKPIIVPAKLVPDFSVFKNCTGQETLFTDITNSAADPVTNRDWNFNNLGTGTGSPETFTFTTTGNKNVTLTLTTQTGCTYAVTKVVNIISSPQSNFTATPEAGAPPLEVQFTNTSVGATSYLWSFNDSEGTTSNQVSPSFTYQDLGEYVVDLTAFNAQNCSHTFSREINVVLPVVDVALIGLELMEFPDGSIKPAVTIFNHGNTPVNNLGLLVDVSGPVIREYISTTILPGTSYRHVLEIDFPDPDPLDYLCIEADIEDISPQDNQVCQNIEKKFIMLPPYPNPTNGELHIDWILNEDGVVNISVINSMGQAVEDFSVNSSEGLNPITLETAGMSSGVYLVRLDYKSSTRVYRVFIAE